jgi:hypothetical protein
MIPKIFKSPITNLWYIATDYKEKDGLVEAKTKQEIPSVTIEQMVWDFLLREQMRGCNKGYSISVKSALGKFNVTVTKEE